MERARDSGASPGRQDSGTVPDGSGQVDSRSCARGPPGADRPGGTARRDAHWVLARTVGPPRRATNREGVDRVKRVSVVWCVGRAAPELLRRVRHRTHVRVPGLRGVGSARSALRAECGTLLGEAAPSTTQPPADDTAELLRLGRRERSQVHRSSRRHRDRATWGGPRPRRCQLRRRNDPHSVGGVAAARPGGRWLLGLSMLTRSINVALNRTTVARGRG